MLSYFFNRLGYGVVVLFLVTIIVSSIVYLSPVDPTRLTFGQRMDEHTVELKRKQLGLDLPLHLQVIKYLADVSPVLICRKDNWSEEYKGMYTVIGSFAVGVKKPHLRSSYQSGRSVSDIILEAFPNTLYLSIFAIGLAIVMGILLGIIAALNKGNWVDNVVLFVSTLGYSVPSYVTAIVLGVVFGYYMRDFTGLNIQGSLYELNDLGDDIVVWKNLILPAIALGIRPIAIVTQLMRSSMLEVMDLSLIHI